MNMKTITRMQYRQMQYRQMQYARIQAQRLAKFKGLK